MTSGSQRWAPVPGADLPQILGRCRGAEAGGSNVGCGCFSPLFASPTICLEISGTELKSIVAGMLKQLLCVLPGAQDPALTSVIGKMAVMAIARAVAIQALM